MISGGVLVVFGPQRQMQSGMNFLPLTELASGCIVLVGSDGCFSLQWAPLKEPSKVPKIKVGNTFVENVKLPSFFGKPDLTGRLAELDQCAASMHEPQVFYSHPHGELWIGDCLTWLETLEPESVDLVFADPPYNLGKADWDHFESHDEYVRWSVEWIEVAARVLKRNGTLYVCGFSEILSDIRRPALKFFDKCRWLVWFYKNKANLTNDWGRSHESILHFRKSKDFIFNVDEARIPYGEHTLKYPVHPQAASSQYRNRQKNRAYWQPHPDGAKPKDVLEIPVTNNGMKEKTPHPTQKPEELLRYIILASSNEGDLVIDPFSGSGTTLVCAEQLSRRWKGCEINEEYNTWAIARLETVEKKPIRKWIEMDRMSRQRRESIR